MPASLRTRCRVRITLCSKVAMALLEKPWRWRRYSAEGARVPPCWMLDYLPSGAWPTAAHRRGRKGLGDGRSVEESKALAGPLSRRRYGRGGTLYVVRCLVGQSRPWQRARRFLYRRCQNWGTEAGCARSNRHDTRGRGDSAGPAEAPGYHRRGVSPCSREESVFRPVASSHATHPKME